MNTSRPQHVTTAAPAFLIREAAAEDRAAVFSFWERQITSGSRVTEIYRWRESGAPLSGGNQPYIATLDGELAGAMNSVQVVVGWRGQRIPACWQLDTIVSPAARGRGIAGELIRRAMAEYPLVMAKGTSDVMYGVRKKFGFRDAPNRNILICPLTPFVPHGSIARRLKYAAAYARSASLRRDASPAGLSVCAADEFGSEFDRLAETLAGGEMAAPLKTAAYLTWRYLGCPGRSYRVLRADGPGGLRGGVVLRGPEGEEREAWIVDLIADPGDLPAVAALIRAAQNELRARHAVSVRAFATSTRIRQCLYRAGFLDTGQTPRFTYFASEELPFDPEAVGWNFFHGDGDCELYP